MKGNPVTNYFIVTGTRSFYCFDDSSEQATRIAFNLACRSCEGAQTIAIYRPAPHVGSWSSVAAVVGHRQRHDIKLDLLTAESIQDETAERLYGVELEALNERFAA